MWWIYRAHMFMHTCECASLPNLGEGWSQVNRLHLETNYELMILSLMVGYYLYSSNCEIFSSSIQTHWSLPYLPLLSPPFPSLFSHPFPPPLTLPPTFPFPSHSLMYTYSLVYTRCWRVWYCQSSSAGCFICSITRWRTWFCSALRKGLQDKENTTPIRTFFLHSHSLSLSLSVSLSTLWHFTLDVLTKLSPLFIKTPVKSFI